MAKPEAFGKTTPYASCPICHDIMLTEEYNNHIQHSHNQEQRDRFGIKTEEKPGPKGHFYGDVWSKYEQQPYMFTQAEFDAISNEAWEGEGCEDCRSIIQSTEMKGEDYAIYPSSEQKKHMTDMFGYAAEPAIKPTGYLDPEDPQWQQSVEHIQERYKGGPLGTFGPQSGMMRGEPTKDEWQITSYLDEIRVTYIHKMKLSELDPSIERERLEYDIYIPEYHMAIETSPGWHEGGPSEKSFPDVVENDRFKRQFAEERGIDLMSFDPAKGTESFINGTLVPKLRAVEVDAFEVAEEKKHEEDLSTEGRTYGDPRFNEWDTATIYREEEQELERPSWVSPDATYEVCDLCEGAGILLNEPIFEGFEPIVRECPKCYGHKGFWNSNVPYKRPRQPPPINIPVERMEPRARELYYRFRNFKGEEEDWPKTLWVWCDACGANTNHTKVGPKSYECNICLRTVRTEGLLEPQGKEEVGYDWDYNTKYREKPILDEQDKPIGDSWKVKTKHNICRNCGKETELYDICNYHHHVDNFMGEHEKFQMIVDSGGLEWDKLPPELQEFETKYGTAFPCPMDIDPEDMGTFKKEEQTDVPEGVVPPEGYARQTTEEAAMGVLDHLIKGGVESFESWDEVIDHLQFLVDTGYIANFQPPNISEKEFEVWKPLIQGLMRQQTRWPNLKEERPKTSICENCGESMTYCSDCDLHHHDSHWTEDHKAMKGRAHFTEEQSGINQNIPTGAYTRLEPLTQDQSQNVPRFPERGKVNTIEQQSGGEEMAAENHLFQEEDEGRWDRPAPDTPEDEAMRKTYGELADETGDNVLQLVQDGTITPEAGDVLMEYQTKAKEAVMTSHFVEAHELLEKMAAYLLSAIPGLSD